MGEIINVKQVRKFNHQGEQPSRDKFIYLNKKHELLGYKVLPGSVRGYELWNQKNYQLRLEDFSITVDNACIIATVKLDRKLESLTPCMGILPS